MLNSHPFSSFGFRSFLPLCSAGTFGGPPHLQRDGASTLPRAKSKTYGSNPGISLPLSQKLDCLSTVSARRLKSSDFLHPASESADPPPRQDLPPPCVSTLPVPTLRLSPSPTSLCQGTNLDGSGPRQPSPVAGERRARSISILTANIHPVSGNERSANKAGRGVFESLTDVNHPALRGDRSLTHAEAHRETRDSSAPHQEVDLSSNADKSKTPTRKMGVPTIPPPNFNSKKQLEFLPIAATSAQTTEPGGITLTGVQRKPQLPVFDVQPIHSGLNLHRKHGSVQTGGFGFQEPLPEHLSSGRNAAAPPGSDSMERFWNRSTVIPKPRRFNCDLFGPLDEHVQAVPTGLSSMPYQKTSATQNRRSPQKQRKENPNTQDVGSTLTQPCIAVRDYCSRSKSDCHDSYLSQSKVHPLSPEQQQAHFPASLQCRTAQTKCSKPDITPPRDQKLHLGPDKSRMAVNLSDTELIQRAEGPAELPECSPQSRVENRPLSVEQRSRSPNGSGNSSNGVFDFLVRPQRGVYQRAADATLMASPVPNRANYRRPARAVFLEEDPYYVTMYHPGSVYVGE